MPHSTEETEPKMDHDNDNDNDNDKAANADIDPNTIPLDTKIDGTPFSVLLSQAVKLKSAQEAPLRSFYDSIPSFYQNSIFPREEVVQARNSTRQRQTENAGNGTGISTENGISDDIDDENYDNYEERMQEAIRFKDRGNAAFQELKHREAIIEYEMALAVFRYLVNTNPNWRNEGIKDEFIREEEYRGKNEEEKHEIRMFLEVCYTNIALVNLKIKNYKLAIEACNYAINLNPNSVKALYLRSKARLTPKSTTRIDENLAIKDLNLARMIDPSNRNIIQELEEIRRMRMKKRARDKKIYNNIFEKTDVFVTTRSQDDDGKVTEHESHCHKNDTGMPTFPKKSSKKATTVTKQTAFFDKLKKGHFSKTNEVGGKIQQKDVSVDKHHLLQTKSGAIGRRTFRTFKLLLIGVFAWRFFSIYQSYAYQKRYSYGLSSSFAR